MNPTAAAIDYHAVVNKFQTYHWRVWNETHKEMEQGGKAALNAAKQAFGHGNWRVRRHVVGFMDHHADNTCVRGLIKALKDPNAHVRRSAIHSFSCDACKTAPLSVDVVPYMLDVVLHDRSLKVRRVALGMLGCRRPDPRVIPVVEKILATEKDPALLSRAKRALRQHSGQGPACNC
jgi:HEAT repeat protein